MVRRLRRRRRAASTPEAPESAAAPPDEPRYDPRSVSTECIEAMLPPAARVDRPGGQEQRLRQAQLEEEYFKRGTMLYGKGLHEEALKNFKSVLKFDANEPEANFNSALCYRSLGKFAEATKHLLAAIRGRPQWAEAWRELGLSLMRQEKWAEAETAFCGAVQNGMTQNERVYERLGRVLWSQQKHKEAADVFEDCLGFAPEHAVSHFHLGLYHSLAGDLSAARESQEQAVRCEPSYAEAWLELGKAQCRLGWAPTALQSFQRVSRLAKKGVEAGPWIELVEKANKAVDVAIQAARPALGVPATAADAAMQAGLKAVEEGKLAAAIALLDAGRDHFPDHAGLKLWSGAAYALNRQYDRAIHAWEEAGPAAKLLLGFGYALTGRWAQALELREGATGPSGTMLGTLLEAIPEHYDHPWSAPASFAPASDDAAETKVDAE